MAAMKEVFQEIVEEMMKMLGYESEEEEQRVSKFVMANGTPESPREVYNEAKRLVQEFNK